MNEAITPGFAETESADYLFVYDELRTTAGHPLHNYLRAYCDYLGLATVPGILIEVEGRPAVLPSGNPDERVSGELFRIHPGATAQLFQVLDPHQGCVSDNEQGDAGFFRHHLQAELQAETLAETVSYDAWVYLYRG